MKSYFLKDQIVVVILLSYCTLNQKGHSCYIFRKSVRTSSTAKMNLEYSDWPSPQNWWHHSINHQKMNRSNISYVIQSQIKSQNICVRDVQRKFWNWHGMSQDLQLGSHFVANLIFSQNMGQLLFPTHNATSLKSPPKDFNLLPPNLSSLIGKLLEKNVGKDCRFCMGLAWLADDTFLGEYCENFK